jgi:hypothetical protein
VSTPTVSKTGSISGSQPKADITNEEEKGTNDYTGRAIDGPE